MGLLNIVKGGLVFAITIVIILIVLYALLVMGVITVLDLQDVTKAIIIAVPIFFINGIIVDKASMWVKA